MTQGLFSLSADGPSVAKIVQSDVMLGSICGAHLVTEPYRKIRVGNFRLKVFHRVTDNSNLRQGAEVLYLTHSAVALQIKALEEKLRAPPSIARKTELR